MYNLDAARSFYVYVKSLFPQGTATKFILESSVEDANAIMTSNSVCVAVGDDTPTFKDSRLGRKRTITVGIHLINADGNVVLQQEKVLLQALQTNNAAQYYDYTVPAGTAVLGTKVGWDASQLQFLHVENPFNVGYRMCEIELFYYF